MKINLKSIKFSAALLACAMAASSCEDVFEPAAENLNDLDFVIANGDYMSGILSSLYGSVPALSNSIGSDLATSDITALDDKNTYKNLSNTWTAASSPFSGSWTSCLNWINYCNIFIAHCGETKWQPNENDNNLLIDRFTAEARALRGIYGYTLLKYFGGKDNSGNFLGYPIFLNEFNGVVDFNMPRNSFQECLNQIVEDLDYAIDALPEDYKTFSDDEVPEKYKKMGVNGIAYSTAFGSHLKGKISGRIAKAYKSKALLLAASPAFEGACDKSYADAAKVAGELIASIGGVEGLDPDGITWYAQGDDFQAGSSSPEVIWRNNKNKGSADYDLGIQWEKRYLPPTLNGQATAFPTQNIVDAFGMVDGYPTAKSSKFDSSNPYEGRDPRLAKYIIFDGSKMSDKVINTAAGSGNDGYKATGATVTGYYLKKHLREDATIAADGTSSYQFHFKTILRYTEVFLNFAEAANEAYGPKGNDAAGFSAFDVIKAIRERAGICKGEEDPYLNQCANSKEDMRELIRNERRIELCFEDQRFFDLRRWKDMDGLNETVYGCNISGTGNKTYTNEVEHTISYKDYMIYCPVPDKETLKWSNLAQNMGW